LGDAVIRMNGFRREPEELRARELAAVDRVLRSGWYVLGAEVRAFEQEWASAVGTAHVVGVGNGMDAIEIGLRALGIGAGDEVITTPMTAFATVLAILRAGAEPVLADIDPGTAQLSPESAERCLSPRTRAVLLVHLYGHAHDLDRWESFCEGAGILLLEDCAQAHLASWSGVRAGAWGRMGAYSFYPTKNLGAIGDGGALVTNDEAIAASARQLRNYGQSDRYHHPVLGLNSRLDELHAAILRVRLGMLEEFTARRRAIAQAYRGGIANPAIRLLAAPRQAGSHVYHLFVVCCAQRDRLAEHLRARGVESLVHYPIPVHGQAPCTGLRRDPAGLQASERHARECLSIPCHPQLDDAEVDTVTRALNEFA
jgi:dTDP-4-amino-4,6-dideoxygalactose transaminase